MPGSRDGAATNKQAMRAIDAAQTLNLGRNLLKTGNNPKD